MLQELLEKYNLKYEDLNPAERDTLMGWMKGVAGNVITSEQLRQYIQTMKDSVENDIATWYEPKNFWEWMFGRRKDIYRRARLKNYMLLLAFLTGPEKAKKALEASLQNIKPQSNVTIPKPSSEA